MRTYANVWRVTVIVLGAGALVLAGAGAGWATTIATTAAFAFLGLLFGFSWVEDPRRRGRAMARGALWFGVTAVLVIGLPTVLGAWTMLVLLLLAAGAPEVLELAARTYRTVSPVPATEHPERLSDRDLGRRWKGTTDRLHDRSLTPAATLELVEERSLLLDELERRDPDRFERWLADAGWREPQDW